MGGTSGVEKRSRRTRPSSLRYTLGIFLIAAPRRYLSLRIPPGCRFLVAGDYIDVWFDESLFNV